MRIIYNFNGLNNIQADVHNIHNSRLGKKLTLDSPVGDFVWLRDPSEETRRKESTVVERFNAETSVATFLHRRSVRRRNSFRDNRRLPQLIPLFPVGNYTPDSECGHCEPIQEGSAFCCMICHMSGQDEHPALRKSCLIKLNSGVKRDTALGRKCSKQRISLETRKQRRQRLFSGILDWSRVCFYRAKLDFTDSVSARKV